MTVAWDSVKTAIVSFLDATKVVGAEHVVWEREAVPLTYDDVIELRFSGEDSVGYDDVAHVETEPGVFHPRVTGWREFVLSIRFYSRSQATAARYALERVRASFHHPQREAILSDAGVAFLSTETLQTFDAVEDERWESVGVLDVRLGVVSDLFEPDEDSDAFGYLTEIGVSIQGRPEETIHEP